MGTFITPGGANDGHDILTVWTPGSSILTLDDDAVFPAVVGVRFTGLPFTARNDGLPTPTTFNYTDQVITSFTFTLELVVPPLTVAAPRSLSLFVIDQVNPPVFATVTQVPSTLPRLEVARTTILGTELDTASFVFTCPDNENADVAVRDTAALGIARLNEVYRKVGFQGNIAFAVDFTTRTQNGDIVSFMAAEGAGAEAVLNTVEFTDITGINKHWRAHSRADRCPKCGSLTVREKLVEDGFKRGLLVCQSCYDPPDFHSEWGRRGVGRERQGIND